MFFDNTLVASKMLVVLIVSLFSMSAASSLRSAPIYELEDAELHFETFIQRHGKQYADENEKQARFEIFKVNLEKVNRLNDGQNDAVFGLTFFMDLTHEEFLRQYTGLGQNLTEHRNCPYASEEEIKDVQAPDSFDWRQQNAVTVIKNQKGCGSCFAFSAIANVESQYAIKYGQHIDLAEQQIVDCDTTSCGCGGGWASNVLMYLTQAGGAVSENDYPYREAAGTCQFDQSRAIVRLASCRSFSVSSQESLKQLLYTNGPISIAIQASGISEYHGGLITDQMCNVNNINHAVLLVGYGFDSKGVPMWIGKNSWGTGWGDQGYFYFVRGENAQSCGMMNNYMCSSVLA